VYDCVGPNSLEEIVQGAGRPVGFRDCHLPVFPELGNAASSIKQPRKHNATDASDPPNVELPSDPRLRSSELFRSGPPPGQGCPNPVTLAVRDPQVCDHPLSLTHQNVLTLDVEVVAEPPVVAVVDVTERRKQAHELSPDGLRIMLRPPILVEQGVEILFAQRVEVHVDLSLGDRRQDRDNVRVFVHQIVFPLLLPVSPGIVCRRARVVFDGDVPILSSVSTITLGEIREGIDLRIIRKREVATIQNLGWVHVTVPSPSHPFPNGVRQRPHGREGLLLRRAVDDRHEEELNVELDVTVRFPARLRRPEHPVKLCAFELVCVQPLVGVPLLEEPVD